MQNQYLIYGFTIAGCIGVLLQIAVIYAMSRSALPRYWGVFLYLLVLFLTSVCDMAGYLHPGGYPDWYRDFWLINNIIRHLSGFIAVLSLVFVATVHHPSRRTLRFGAIAGTLVVVAISVLWPEESLVATAMRSGRDLSFFTIVLNLILWSSLIRVRHQDLRLFLVSGGLGVNMTGEAIAQSISMLSGSGVFANILAVVSHLLCLAIWWKAFRLPAAARQQSRTRRRQDKPRLDHSIREVGGLAPNDLES